MRSCKEITRLVSESLDRKLPWHDRLAVRFHLVVCGLCSRFQKQMRFLRAAVRRHAAAIEDSEIPSGATLSPEAKDRIKESLCDHS